MQSISVMNTSAPVEILDHNKAVDQNYNYIVVETDIAFLREKGNKVMN